jgi:hypothetical protein
VADRGNHAIRVVNFRTGSLMTLAGDPAAAESRWGLLRDGTAVDLGPEYAAIAGPLGLAPGAKGAPGSILVATGRGLAEIRDSASLRDRLEVTLQELPAAARNEPFPVTFTAAPLDMQDRVTALPVHDTVDILEHDGTLAARKRGTLPGGGSHTIHGVFAQAGPARVLLRCVTDQGVSAGASRDVAVH